MKHPIAKAAPFVPLVCILLLAGCSYFDPVVGSWKSTGFQDKVVVFHANGTGGVDADYLEQKMKEHGQQDPATLKRIKESTEKISFHWYKEGKVYRISDDAQTFPIIPGPGWVKVEGGKRLLPCTEDGFPAGMPYEKR